MESNRITAIINPASANGRTRMTSGTVIECLKLCFDPRVEVKTTSGRNEDILFQTVREVDNRGTGFRMKWK